MIASIFSSRTMLIRASWMIVLICDADNCAAWASNFLCSSNEVRSGWADGSGLGWGVLTRRRDREGEGEGAGALLGRGARGVQLPAQPAFCRLLACLLVASS